MSAIYSKDFSSRTSPREIQGSSWTATGFDDAGYRGISTVGAGCRRLPNCIREYYIIGDLNMQGVCRRGAERKDVHDHVRFRDSEIRKKTSVISVQPKAEVF